MSGDRQPAAATVCVVITCYNQAHFLPDAIRSALSQTRAADEIIVIDDGSTDETAAVAEGFQQVDLVRQENRGLAAARNRGCRQTSCGYLVCLDADDLLRPMALSAGLSQFSDHPNCAFIAGHYRYVREDGTLLAEHPQKPIDADTHAAFLRGNWVGLLSSVMFRRSAIVAVEGFDERLPAGEDYDLYLRLTSRHPVSRYQTVVAEYRQHGRNMSANIHLMLPTILAMLRKNAPSPQDRHRHAAYRAGLRAWKAHYCTAYLAQGPREPGIRARDAKAVVRYAPVVALGFSGLESWRRLRDALRAPDGFSGRMWDWLRRPGVGRIRLGALDRSTPLQSASASSIEGHYVAAFLASVEPAFSGGRKGTILFDARFRVTVDALAEVQAWHRVPLDFTSPAAEDRLVTDLDRLADGSPQECLLVLHCLSQVYDLAAAIRSLARALKPGGRLLATVPGCALAPSSGTHCYRRFTPYSLEQFMREEEWVAAESTAYGNVLVDVSALHGVPASSLRGRELRAGDPCYPVVVGLSARRSDLPVGAQDSVAPAGTAA